LNPIERVVRAMTQLNIGALLALGAWWLGHLPWVQAVWP